MRPVPIPDHLRSRYQTAIIGEPGMSPADDDAPSPVEYVVAPSTLYPGRPTFNALITLDDEDVARIAAGARLVWLTLDGAEVPWSLVLADQEMVAEG